MCQRDLTAVNGFSRVFLGVSRKFRGCLKFQGCFKRVLRVFQGSFKSVSRKFQECFKEVSGKFQGCFKNVSKVFQVRLKEISRDIKGVKVCQGALNGVSRVV